MDLGQRKKPNYLLKSYLLNYNQDLLKELRQASYNEYRERELCDNGVILCDAFKGDNCITYEDVYIKYNYSPIVKECVKINHAFTNRKFHLKDRIKDIYLDSLNSNCNCYFLTLTFSNELITKTSEKTRRRYITRLLKKYCRHYVGNIDFGVDKRYTEREHYHAFISTNKIQELMKAYYKLTNSYVYTEKMRVKDNLSDNCKRLSKYIAKLTNHAIKESVKRNVYVFDRNNDYLLS